MEFIVQNNIYRSYFINQKGVFQGVFEVTKQDIFNLFKEHIPDDAEIVRVIIYGFSGSVYEDQGSNETTILDIKLKYSDVDVFVTSNIRQYENIKNRFLFWTRDFMAGRGLKEGMQHLEGLVVGTNNSPLIFDLFVTPRDSVIQDPFTSLEFVGGLSIKIKYRVCTPMPIGTDADDCE